MQSHKQTRHSKPTVPQNRFDNFWFLALYKCINLLTNLLTYFYRRRFVLLCIYDIPPTKGYRKKSRTSICLPALTS